jgi:hypothetical protein
MVRSLDIFRQETIEIKLTVLEPNSSVQPLQWSEEKAFLPSDCFDKLSLNYQIHEHVLNCWRSQLEIS